MRKTHALCLAVFLAAALTLHADDWQKSYTVNGTPTVQVDTKDGNVDITAVEGNTVQAHIVTKGWKIGEGGVRIAEHQDGNIVHLDVQVPHSGWCIGFCYHSVDIHLQVPKQTNLQLRTGDGNVEGGGVAGETEINTGDGNVTMNAMTGTLNATTGDGNVRADGRFNRLRVQTGDGNVELSAAQGSNVMDDWSIRTGDGNVQLRVPDGLNADLDARTGDGEIKFDLPVTVTGSVSHSSLRGKLGQGGNLLEIRTGDGSIRLEH